MDCPAYLTAMAIFICLVVIQETRQEVPLAIRKKLASINTTEQLISTLVMNKDDARRQQIGRVVEVPLECIPREVPVQVPDPMPGYVYYPTCIGLNQCTGCCDDTRLKCSPVITRTVPREVMRLTYSVDENELTFVDYALIPFTEHETCSCNCRVTIHDCDGNIHEYDPDACLCRCRNSTAANSCAANKLWSDGECECLCPELKNCFEDEVFDFSSCSCKTRIQILPVADDNRTLTADHV